MVFVYDIIVHDNSCALIKRILHARHIQFNTSSNNNASVLKLDTNNSNVKISSVYVGI